MVLNSCGVFTESGTPKRWNYNVPLPYNGRLETKICLLKKWSPSAAWGK